MNVNDKRFAALIYTYVVGLAAGVIISDVPDPSDLLVFVMAIVAGVVGFAWSYVMFKVLEKEAVRDA